MAPASADFVVGPENRLVTVVANAFQSGDTTSYSPLVLYGPSASGKTHVSRGLVHCWRERHPTAAIVVTDGTSFARDYTAALADQQLAAWQQSLREADLFVLEDLGQLAGKAAAQQELIHTLDELSRRDATVLVTARTLPRQISAITPALRSRLSVGLAVPLTFPGPGARRVILERLAKSRGWVLPTRILKSFAGGPSVSVSALYGAIRQLELAVAANPTDSEKLQQLAEPHTESISLRQIALATARHFGLKLADLKSSSRRQAIVTARGVAIYLARLLTRHSLQEIGSYFGGRDHTTVLHGHRRTEKMIKRDPATKHAVHELRRMLVA
jgi:chromosomal replication initiator protein